MCFKPNLAIFAVRLCMVLSGLGPTAALADQDADEILASYPLSPIDGSQEVVLSTYRGQVVLVNFWASWCAPCLKELPVMNRWHESWRERGGRVAAISVDHHAYRAVQFAKDAGLTLDIYLDGPDGLARQLDIPSLPLSYLLDRSGRIALTVCGSSKQDLAELERVAEGMLAAKASTDSLDEDAK